MFSGISRPQASKLLRFYCIYHPCFTAQNLGNWRLFSTVATTSIPEDHSLIHKNVKPYQEERWERNFEQLKNELASKSEIRDKFLKDWVKRQRLDFMKWKEGDMSALNDDRLSKLQSLDKEYGIIDVVERGSLWEVKFNELLDFMDKHGGIFPFEMEEEEMTPETEMLEDWCSRQRNAYQMYKKGQVNGGLTPARIKKLEEIGFQWSVNNAKWSQRYLELVQYYKIHGNSLVPNYYAENPGLARWVKRQRHKIPSAERRKLLDDVGFVWDPFEYRWMLKYNELKAYVAVHGKGQLPGKRNQEEKSLFRWVKYQQACHRKFLQGQASSMTKHRKQLLEVLGVNLADKNH